MNLKQITGKSRISDGRFKAFSQRQQDELDEEWNWFVNSESSYKGGEEIAKELRNLLETAQSREDISAIRKKRGSLLSYCGKYIDRSYFKSLDSRLAAEKYLSEIYMSEEDYQNMFNEARQRVYSNVSDSRRVKDEYTEPFWYGFGDAYADRYNVDRELEDEDLDIAEDLMAKADEIINKYFPNGKNSNKLDRKNIDIWVKVLYDVMRLLGNTPMENPDGVYYYLEDANYHFVTSVMCLVGLCSDEIQQQELDFLKDKEYSKHWLARNFAEEQIAIEMGLL